jgi:hypothetical protein
VSRLKRILLGLTILLLVLVGVVAWMFRSRAETIPDELPAIDVAEADPQKIVIPGSPGMPDFKLADYKGKTLYLVVGDRESMTAGESKLFDRALARWKVPDDVVGVAIADTEGFKLFASKIEQILAPMRPEIRLPLYVDYEGAVTRAFKLPKGHVGVVVIGPDGAITMRHSGPPQEGDGVLDQLKQALRAEEPALPAAPAFTVGALDNAACKGKSCVFVLLSRPVQKAELPGVEGGFEGEDEAAWKQLQDPDIRLASLVVDSDKKLAADDKAAARVEVVLVGELGGVELKRWKTTPSTPELRAAFALKDSDTAILGVDPGGKLKVRETGLVLMYKFNGVSELLGIDLNERRQ